MPSCAFLNRFSTRSLVMLACLTGLLPACSVDESSPGTEGTAENLLQPLDINDWDNRLGDYPPDILVVDYWATWCAPCIERFPHMVEMAENYADQGIAFVSLNLDDPEDMFAREQAEDFLQSMDANFEHLAIDGNIFEAMAFLGLEAIPAVSIFDRTGIEVTRLGGTAAGGVFDEADVKRAIEDLLAAQPAP